MSRFRRYLAIVLVSLLGACTTSASGTTTSSSGAGATTSTSERSATSTVGSPPTTSAANPANLLVVGDWGSGHPAQTAVADAMSQHSAETEVSAILTTGDNFYNDDLELLMQPFGWATESDIPFWITWGNHDVESETRIAAVNQAFDDPPRWDVYEWGAVDVIVLDTNQITSPQQALFFLNAMGDSDRPTIVAMHHPPYSCAHEGSTTKLVDQVVEVLDDDVLLVLSGHEHVYQRFERDGIAYVVTGGGGATIYELSQCPVNQPEPLAGEATHHFLALEQTTTSVQVTAINVNGDAIDEFTVPFP